MDKSEELLKRFRQAIERVQQKSDVSVSNEEKLLFYAYYKQVCVIELFWVFNKVSNKKQYSGGMEKKATTGPCNIPRPSFMAVRERYKWDSWNKLGMRMTKEEAMEKYVEIANKLLPIAANVQ
jgi:acyl-CoA-binding protein